MSSALNFDRQLADDFSLYLGKSFYNKVDELGCHLIRTGRNSKTNENFGVKIKGDDDRFYNLDSVITNESMQPLILIEYKYIRYKKHNRDKGSWLCTAHNAIRRRYNSVRSSIAILAGSWSGSSVAMMKSQDINLFIIPFDKITALLKKHKIKFDWGEKDRHIASQSWKKYSALSRRQKLKIAEEMIAEIKPDLEEAIEKTLDNSAKRKVEKVSIEIHTNIGEVKRFEFENIEAALNFLEDFSFEEMLNNAHSFTLFDKPQIDPDEESEE